MTIRKLYQNGYKKAFNVSYDDGVIQDERFVKLLNKYGIVGTFNLNSEATMKQIVWQHHSGLQVCRLTKEQVLNLYEGHEVASHSLTHPNLAGMDAAAVMRELIEDKKNLEEWFGREVKGFAYPFGAYNELTTQCVKDAGFVYARIAGEAGDFSIPNNPLLWQPSFFHISPGVENFIYQFAQCDDELALCQIMGHTYELDVCEVWHDLEKMLAFISQKDDIWFASNIDIVEYLEAMKSVKIQEDRIINSSGKALWFEIDGKEQIVRGLAEIEI